MSIDSDLVWDEIVEIKYLEDPKEYVYDFTIPKNENFMIYNGIMTHNTLNSVDWNEEIYYKKDDNIVVDTIGNIIDSELDKEENKNKIEHHANETEYLDIQDKNYYTPSVDEYGKMYWKKIEALTRHLPGGKLVNVKTKSGRSVKATKSHSLLVYENNKIVPKLGSEVKIGDLLPIMNKYPKTDLIQEYNGVKLTNENGYKMGYCKFIDANILLSPEEFVKGFISGYLDKKYNEKDIKIQDNKMIINNVYNQYYD
jgi:intein/homing endonuclease